VVTFGFRTVLLALRTERFLEPLMLVTLGLLAFPALVGLGRFMKDSPHARYLPRLRLGLVTASLVGLALVIVDAAGQVIGTRTLETLTVRDLGVSGIGTAPALIALTLYSLLPLVRNTYAGLKNIDPAVIDSGRGMGMTASQIFFRIELPMAFPVIMAGVRNAGISLVGIAAVASIIGAGALGDFILLGVNTTSIDLILLGAIPAIGLAVVLDTMLQILEALFTSPGIRQVS
jgi:ABC-type proline/glycine betaine transport system permease subunit